MLICNADNSASPENTSAPPFSIIITIAILLFFLASFFSVFLCKWLMQNLGNLNHNLSSPVPRPMPPPADTVIGLDPVIINSFPTFMYSTVKDYRREKYGLECAICLCEFEDDNMLRLVTECCHVFHQECVDLWLESHTSCPVCRRSLDISEKSPEKSPAPIRDAISLHGEVNNIDHKIVEGSVSVTIRDDIEERREKGLAGERAAPMTPEELKRFSRSNSTGHSIIRAREEEEDRYRLILPEHVKAKLLRGHNWTKSCTTFDEFKNKTTAGKGGFGEISGELGKH